MTARLRNRLHLFLILIAVSALIGAVYGAILDVVIRSELTPASLLRGAMRGVIIGGVVWSFEIYLNYCPLGARLRRAPFVTSFVLRSVASTVVLMAAIIASRAILSNRGHSMELWLSIGFLRDTGVALLVVSALHFVAQVRRIVGARVLTNMILGRYHRPVAEERIFLFLDITGSTRLAQALGDTGAHALVTRFFFDIADPVIEYGGETHRYIGDEVVVTWPMLDKAANARPLQAYVAICERIRALGPTYEKDFGVIPQFRVGLHGGPVVAGECGDDKRDIVYFGDTVNTAKRIEQACRDFDHPMLISGDLLAAMALPQGYKVESQGRTVLRGRDRDIELFSLEGC